MNATRRALLDVGVAGLALVATLAILGARGFGTPDPAARHLDALGVALAVLSAAPLALRSTAPLALRRRWPGVGFAVQSTALLALRRRTPGQWAADPSTAPSALRRRWPGVGFAVSAVASLALLGLGYPLDAPVSASFAAYALAVAYSGGQGPRRWAALIAVNAFVPAVAVAYALHGVNVADIATELLAWAAVFAGVWIAGDRNRLRELQLAEAQESARRLAIDAERERRLVAAHERTRIARELHDSAGHAINVILVQAGAARLLQERNPEGTRRAIETIEEVARDTIGDIDRLVRALRDDESDIPADPGALDDLLARHRAGGLTIAADLPDQTAPLPRSVAWATYRILQEALTNAARHGPGSATVAVRFHRHRVEIDVTNPTAEAPPNASARPNRPRPTDARSDRPRPADTQSDQPRPADTRSDRPRPADTRSDQPRPADTRYRGLAGTGHHDQAERAAGARRIDATTRTDGTAGGYGIAGMRERATLLGGTLRAGTEDGVFRLHAVLPHGGPPHATTPPHGDTALPHGRAAPPRRDTAPPAGTAAPTLGRPPPEDAALPHGHAELPHGYPPHEDAALLHGHAAPPQAGAPHGDGALPAGTAAPPYGVAAVPTGGTVLPGGDVVRTS